MPTPFRRLEEEVEEEEGIREADRWDSGHLLLVCFFTTSAVCTALEISRQLTALVVVVAVDP